MASEYLKWKYRDVTPRETASLTGKQKLANWWHYHKWHLVIGLILLVILAELGWHALGIGKVQPDLQIAYVGATPLPEQAAAALEHTLANLIGDRNADGMAVVRLNQYPAGDPSSDADAAAYAAGAQIRLMADLEDAESSIFLLHDAQAFQRSYDILAAPDGKLATQDQDLELLRWEDCPRLAELQLGGYDDTVLGQSVQGDTQALLAPLYIARRGYDPTRTPEDAQTLEDIWNLITEGAES